MSEVKKALLQILLVLAAACGPGDDREGGPPEGPPPPAPAACTGPVPANSMRCPGAGAGLTVDTPRVVTGACASPVRPCSHVCNAGFVVEDGACVSAPATPGYQFTDNGDGTVTVTGPAGRLTWLRDSNCEDVVVLGGRAVAGGTGTWGDATAWAAGLAAGVCGLADGSAAGDWRLPSHVELTRMALALEAGGSFPGVQTGIYWTSWSYWPDKAAGVELFSGDYYEYPRTSLFRIWPVR